MKRYAIIGNPIGHSLSPAMQQAAFKATGIDAIYEALAVETAQLDDALVRLSSQYDGWNVTTPLKEAMAARADALTVEARNANAANVVRREDDGRLTAHNTDGDGCVRAIVEQWSWQPGGGALVLGSGPAARAIAIALRAAGEEAVQCWSRGADRSAAGSQLRVADLHAAERSADPRRACRLCKRGHRRLRRQLPRRAVT